MKRIILLSGTTEQRAALLIPIKNALQADSNSVYSDIISIEDFARQDMKGAYSDLKKRLRMALDNSREWVVVDIPADVKNAWQTYINICLNDFNQNFYFYGFSVDATIRKVNCNQYSFTNYCDVDPAKCAEILDSLLTFKISPV